MPENFTLVHSGGDSNDVFGQAFLRSFFKTPLSRNNLNLKDTINYNLYWYRILEILVVDVHMSIAHYTPRSTFYIF